MKDAEEKRFLKAYEAYADAIFRYCYMRISDRELALDLMQETFCRTWDYMRGGREIRNMRAFLFRTARNSVVDQYRKRKSASLDSLFEEGFQFEGRESEDIGKIVDGKVVLNIIEGLDPLYRDPLLLRYVDEFSVKEIAEIIGKRENTISVCLHRGLRQLRNILGKKKYGA